MAAVRRPPGRITGFIICDQQLTSGFIPAHCDGRLSEQPLTHAGRWVGSRPTVAHFSVDSIESVRHFISVYRRSRSLGLSWTTRRERWKRRISGRARRLRESRSSSMIRRSAEQPRIPNVIWTEEYCARYVLALPHSEGTNRRWNPKDGSTARRPKKRSVTQNRDASSIDVDASTDRGASKSRAKNLSSGFLFVRRMPLSWPYGEAS